MQRRSFIHLAAASGATLFATNRSFNMAKAPTTMMSEPPIRVGYAPVNGLEMYFEIHGDGEPLVLLHGAYGAIENWGPVLTQLAANRQVIAVEVQGHGHTADIDRPFSYENFADDIGGLMDFLSLQRADVVGYSMGGNTGLQMAIRHPEKVRNLVAIAANYRLDGYYPEVLQGIAALTPEFFIGTPVEEMYARVAPRPEDFPRLVEKLRDFDLKDFAFPDEDIRAISAPTQLIWGDSDIVRLDHMIAMFDLLGGGVAGGFGLAVPESQLAILPGANHLTVVTEHTERLVTMMTDFLDGLTSDDEWNT